MRQISRIDMRTFGHLFTPCYFKRRTIMGPLLSGLHVAILVTDGFEQAELTEVKAALEQEGAITKIVSDKQDAVQGMHHDANGEQFDVDLTLAEADPADFDAVMLPGGPGSTDQLRGISKAQEFVQGLENEGKSIAAICHGAGLLISAGLVEGRALTSVPGLQEEIRAAGGNWIEQDVVVDGYWVTGRRPDDLPAFISKMIEVIAGRMQANLRGTADEHAVGIASS
jgi:protease I